MKIQSLRIRDGGTHIDLDDGQYHFAPNDAGHHVADVSNPKHLRALLATEAFTVYDPDAQPKAEEPAAPTVIVAKENLDDKTDAELKAIYQSMFGKAAGNKGRAKLIAELTAKLDAQAAEIAAITQAAEAEQDDFEDDEDEDQE